MDKKPVFSIIIPVYNTEKYIAQCLNSIFNQTFLSFEIICVDNGSTDNSLKILHKYCSKYSNIKILTETSKGAGVARNKALEFATGEYICFVDSDDFILPDLLSECYTKIADNPDIIIFGAKTLKSNHIKSGQYSSKNFPEKFSTEKIFNFHTIACNKIYKSSFLKSNNIKFGKTITGEDQIFTVKALILAKNICILKKDLYIYRRNRNGSLTNNKMKKDLSPILTTYEIENFFTEIKINYDLCQKILGKYVLKSISWYGKTEKEFADIYFEELSKMLNFIKKRKGRYWWDYFHLTKNCSYLQLKINYIRAFALYLWYEKMFIIPAGFLFGFDTILDILIKGEK